MASRSGGNRHRFCLVLAALAGLVLALPAGAQSQPGQDGVDASTLAPPYAIESGQLAPLAPVEGGQLAPIPGTTDAAPLRQTEASPPVAGFGPGLWQGLTAPEAAVLAVKAEIPLHSPVLAGLWRRLMLSEEEPAGGQPGQFFALRLDGLYRAGLLKDATALLARAPKPADPQQTASGARVLMGLGDDARACNAVKTIPLSGGPLKGRIRNDALLMVAYCAARDKQPNHASLAAEVLRDQNFAEPLALAVLDSIAESKTPKLPRTDNLTLIDYKFMSLLGKVPVERVLPRATPDLMVAIANDPSAEASTRVAAGEAAVRINALDEADLAGLYRTVAVPAAPAAANAGLQRAGLFQAAETEQTPNRRAALVHQLLDLARRDGLLMPVARAIAPLTDQLRETPDLAGFTETAIETLLAAGKYDHAVGWTLFGGTEAGPGGNPLLHWMTLIDIADAEGHVPHGSSLQYAEDLAAGGALSPIMLQRLATVLAALQYEIPAPIAQGSQNVAKADQGKPPEPSLLPRLQEAATKKAIGKTVLLAIATMGPGPATSVHPQALGETIHALAAAGLEADARRLAFEALYDAWPRRAGLGLAPAPPNSN